MFHTTRLPPLAMGCACMHGSHPARAKLELNGNLAFVLHDLGPADGGKRRCTMRVVHDGATVAELPVLMSDPEGLSEGHAVRVLNRMADSEPMAGRRRRRRRRRGKRRRQRRQTIGDVANRASNFARGVSDAFGGGGRRSDDPSFDELPEDFFAETPQGSGSSGNSTLVIGGLAAAAVAALALSS